jgi:predicted nucleic acid-binding protein
VLADERFAPAVRERLAVPGQALAAPNLLDFEVASAVRRKLLREEIRHEQAAAAIALLERLRVTRYPNSALLRRSWEMRDRLTIYDAAYVALAERLAVPLVTLDARLQRTAARHVAVELPAHP